MSETDGKKTISLSSLFCLQTQLLSPFSLSVSLSLGFSRSSGVVQPEHVVGHGPGPAEGGEHEGLAELQGVGLSLGLVFFFFFRRRVEFFGFLIFLLEKERENDDGPKGTKESFIAPLTLRSKQRQKKASSLRSRFARSLEVPEKEREKLQNSKTLSLSLTSSCPVTKTRIPPPAAGCASVEETRWVHCWKGRPGNAFDREKEKGEFFSLFRERTAPRRPEKGGGKLQILSSHPSAWSGSLPVRPTSAPRS